MAGGKRKKLGAIAHSKGVTFSVWAPLAQNVAVLLPYASEDNSHHVAMERDNEGIWSVTIPGVEIGHYYKYLITNNHGEQVVRNDPRARTLTASGDGSSVVVGNDFDWGDDFFMPLAKSQQVIYELHIGTFNRPDPSTLGTFDSAIEKLDYLQELGVNMIELMPVTSMSFSYGWGYDVQSIFAIENSFGGRRGLMKFVKECHLRGIGVIADVVYNHLFQSDIWQFDGWTDELPGGIYFWNDERTHTPWGSRPNYTEKQVRRYILDSVAMLMNEYRLDGLRLDSTIYLRNQNGTEDHTAEIDGSWSLLQDITELAHRLRPGSIIIAEDIGSNEWLTKPKADGGAGFDAQWRLAFPFALYRSLGVDIPDNQADLNEELLHTFGGNPFSRVIFSDSHDTAANGRARLNEVVAPRRGKDSKAQQELLLANAIVLTAPGIPMLLQGQEFVQDGSFSDWQDLDWKNLETHGNIVQAHQDLISLRTNQTGKSAGLQGSSIAIFHVNHQDHVLAYHRWNCGGPGDDVIVIAHFGTTAFANYDIKLPVAGSWQYNFNSRDYHDNHPEIELSQDVVTTAHDGTCTIKLHPRQVVILTRMSD